MLTETQTRLDILLTQLGLAVSRTAAQKLVEAGSVTVDGKPATKSNQRISQDSQIQVTGPTPKYVSRGGEKLEAALNTFAIDVTNTTCLDIGISTGGFTDCLLQHGAKRIIGVDVGHGQLHSKLKDDARVELREGVNARELSPDDFNCQFDVIVIDVSFISLTLILGVCNALLADGGSLICLIKPQFEVGRDGLGKKGVVTDAGRRENARASVHKCAAELGFEVRGTMESVVLGGDGNMEFVSWLGEAASF